MGLIGECSDQVEGVGLGGRTRKDLEESGEEWDDVRGGKSSGIVSRGASVVRWGRELGRGIRRKFDRNWGEG